MVHRERVLKSLAHVEADRVPWDYWATREVTARLLKGLSLADEEALLRFLDVDFRYVLGPSHAGQAGTNSGDELVQDSWGVVRKKMTVKSGDGSWAYSHVQCSPLENMGSVAEVDGYPHWPSPEGLDYSSVRRECEEVGEYAVVFGGDRLDRAAQLKPMMYLRGMEQTYLDLKQNPEIADSILDHIRCYYLEYNRRVFEAAAGKIDIFLMGDDFGTQEGLMVSLEDWRRYFRDGFRQYIDLAHEYGVKVMHHTCGSVVELIPDFIAAGLDVLQSLQPRAKGMDLARLKREFGRDICLHGGIDIQQVLPRGTPDQVREHVRRQVECAKPAGGYIASTAHNLQPDVPSENILALFDAYREFGSYQS